MKKFIDWDTIEVKGNRTGSRKTTCPACSHERRNKTDPCLSVDFEKGLAHCHHCGAVSMRKEESYKPTYTPPPQDWQNHTNLSDKMVKWCADRGIPQRTLIDFRITEERQWLPQTGKEENCIVFNYFEGEELVNKKFRDGRKNFSQSKDGKRILYNINNIIGEKEVYIVEGEFDVLALHSQGITNVVSLVNGANDHDDQWINSEKYLKDVEHFIIAVDNDPKGIEVREKIAHRLGKWKCSFIEWTNKDANGSLQNGTLEEDLKQAVRFPVSGTHTVKDLEAGIFELYKNGLPKTIKPKHRSFEAINNIFTVMMGHLVTVTGIPSGGKALDVETPIPTPNGFVKMGDLKVGDTVFDELGMPCKVTWKSQIWSDRPTYKMTFSDNSTIICDAKHEWLTDTWKSRRSMSNALRNDRLFERELKPKGTDQRHKMTFPTVKETEEIFNTLKTKNDNRNNHSVKNCRPIQIEEKKLLIDPYVLGCWLGDGNSADGGFTSDDEQIIDCIRERGYNVKKRSSKYGYGIIGLKVQLRELGLLNNKHIPVQYLFSSENQRMELLSGLMDTDGSCLKDGKNEFTSTLKTLANEVYQLISSLGIKVSINESDAKIYGKVTGKRYRLKFKTDLKVYNLERKQNRINEYFEKGGSFRGNDRRYITNCEKIDSVKTQCISVDSDSHLFLAGHQFIPTHNSNFVEWYVLNLVHDYNFKASFFSPEHTPMSLHQTTFIQKAIGRNFWNEINGLPRITEADIERYTQWANEKIYITAPERGDVATWDWLLDKFKEQLYSYGVNIFVIDAFNKVQMPSGNRLEMINDTLTKLTSFAQTNDVLIFLVAHPTKMKKKEGTDEYMMPTLYDVSGSADFRNQTHDGFTIHRHYGSDPYTEFSNMKTKYQFQGSIGQSAILEYDLPTGRYYERGQTPPRFDMTTPMEEQTISVMKPNTNFDIDETDEEEISPF